MSCQQAGALVALEYDFIHAQVALRDIADGLAQARPALVDQGFSAHRVLVLHHQVMKMVGDLGHMLQELDGTISDAVQQQ